MLLAGATLISLMLATPDDIISTPPSPHAITLSIFAAARLFFAFDCH
jgi:hypothetical protein